MYIKSCRSKAFYRECRPTLFKGLECELAYTETNEKSKMQGVRAFVMISSVVCKDVDLPTLTITISDQKTMRKVLTRSTK